MRIAPAYTKWTKMDQVLIRNGRILDPANIVDSIGDLLITDGKISEIGENIAIGNGSSTQIVEATGLIVTPGLIDMHVHLREPGFEHKETISSGTRAAVAGGFTSVACMANTNPVADTPAIVTFIKTQAKKRGAANVFPLGSITKNLAGKELTNIPALLDAGAVAVSDDGKTVMNAEIMRQVLTLSAELDFPVMVHCEEHNLSAGAPMNLGETSRILNLPGSPNAAEDIIVARDIMLAELTGGHIHILHVSTVGAVELIRWGKQKGIRVTAEAMPHHFTLTESEINAHGTNAKMHPPLRTQTDVDAVLQGLVDGTLDAIATDHAPHTASEKAQGLAEAPPGIVGLETCVPLVLTKLVNTNRLSLAEAIAKMTYVPAQILRINRGTLSPGAVADVTIIDPHKIFTVNPEQFQSKSRNTPFGNWKLNGWPTMVFRDGVLSE